MTAPPEVFVAGYQKLRDDYEYPRPSLSPPSSSVQVEYWLADKLRWWPPDRSWAVADRGLGTVTIGFTGEIDSLYAEVQRMWQLLAPSNPFAVWDPFTWKWMVARAVPVSEPGPRPGPGKPAPPNGQASRRAQRDARLAEVNVLYERGSISRQVRDERVFSILDDYPDLN